FAFTLARQLWLWRQPLRSSIIAFASPCVCAWTIARSASRSTFSVCRKRASRTLIVTNIATPTTISVLRLRLPGGPSTAVEGSAPTHEGDSGAPGGPGRSDCSAGWLGIGAGVDGARGWAGTRADATARGPERAQI